MQIDKDTPHELIRSTLSDQGCYLLEPANLYFDRQLLIGKKDTIKRAVALKVTRELINARFCNGTLIGQMLHNSWFRNYVPDRIIPGYGKYCVVLLNTITDNGYQKVLREV